MKNNYLCAKGLPNAIYDNFTPSSNEEAQKRWIARATHCYEVTKEAIKKAQHLYRQYNLYAALQYLVIEDQSLTHLVSSLRIVLNALHKHFSR